MAARTHYPAIDVLESLSRLMTEVIDSEHRRAAQAVRELLAVYRDHEDLISIGAYRRGSNKKVDIAIEMLDDLNQFLRQQVEERSSVEEAKKELLQLFQQYNAKLGPPAKT
jgi:flagellum-specific ATP synthase